LLIYRYIIKAHILPFVTAFATIIFVFTFQFIYKYIDQLLGKGLDWWVITQLITLNLAWMVTLSVPMAVLISTIMAFGMLSSNNESTVIMASGISPFKMILPVIIISVILCYLLILFNNNILPEANHRTKVLMTDIQRTKPVFVIEPGRFTDDINGYNLLINKTYANSNKIEGVYIIDNSDRDYYNTVKADSGVIKFSADGNKIILDLYNGEIHQLKKQSILEDYRRIRFQHHIVTINADGFGFTRSRESEFSRGDRELSADSMKKIINAIIKSENDGVLNLAIQSVKLASEFCNINYNINPEDSATLQKEIQGLLNRHKALIGAVYNQPAVREANQRTINMYLVEIYKKYSIPFACVVFVLIGAPLGMKIKRSGFGVASGTSLGFFLIYWVFLIGGEKLADRQIISPFISMWSANVILGIIGLYLIFGNNINFAKVLRLSK